MSKFIVFLDWVQLTKIKCSKDKTSLDKIEEISKILYFADYPIYSVNSPFLTEHPSYRKKNFLPRFRILKIVPRHWYNWKLVQAIWWLYLTPNILYYLWQQFIIYFKQQKIFSHNVYSSVATAGSATVIPSYFLSIFQDTAYLLSFCIIS